MSKEAQARLKINKLLEEAGWRLLDESGKSATVQVETAVKVENLGDNFEQAKDGFVDYLLRDEDGFPVAVLEAKSEDKEPLVGKEQARKYANSQNVRFIILSNGNLHYFWDKELGNPTRISSFPSLESLKGHKEFTPDPTKLIEEDIDEGYIATTQNPSYKQDPRWKNEDKRQQFIEEARLAFLRPYQIDAVSALQEAVSNGENRFLFEMATGTGKTMLSAAVAKMYLRTGNARRVLFLVDRIELERQAHKAFKHYLQPDYTTVIFKERRDEWRKAEVVVTTIQSITHDNKYLKIFAPTDFDLIISDEAHRSISGNSRTVFEYFIGHKLGLTATPKDYLKNLSPDEVNERDPREIERRVLLSTYQTFGRESGQPTYRYSLADGARDGYLVLPRAIDCRTEVTTKLLSEEGYAVQVQTEEGDEEIIYNQRHFERSFFSDRTNQEFARTVLEHALRDPISNEIGKTIVFCVSRKHARKMAQIFNEMAHQMFPGKYNSDFAVQITSDIADAQDMTTQFSDLNNNLNGRTKFLDGYKSSKTRLCTTVGMMTTGYDCQDILNIALMRPIFSPTDFVQIKGRGTRRFMFRFERDDEKVEEKKAVFNLFDFFGNVEYFEEKYPYDEVIKLPPTGPGTEGPLPPIPPPRPEEVTLAMPDPLKTIEIVNEGETMRIDRELYIDKFENKVREAAKQDEQFKEAVQSGDYEEMEEYARKHFLNKPKEFYTLDRLRKGYRADRRLRLWEILDKALGRVSRFKSKDELAEEEFERFLVASDIPADTYYEARDFFKRYLIDESFRTAVNQRNYGSVAADPYMTGVLNKLGKKRLTAIPDYIKDNVSLNNFA